ncbi:ComEC/Rec2 family competence protein [Olsenella sp. YH-ols2217]|uniref:ComEC/Rec2 family competence protein n=1 Tax=Kribbibacterium absianum TaxID=3044210 RepID=A0ABT6ZJC3_9ACTN|nr:MULTISPECIES: ComEC/Rec2 family competence protein [unclassified Olsenella]MDJ1121414.1 ComEC/Rec2 family competence protein [Olsenella sp. YH-ols2216]MDJ1128904.1 ComEC/Rec2 family competence protein [Olsenella sp. YH-ols2217]
MSEGQTFPERPALPLAFLLFVALFAGARAVLWGGDGALPWTLAVAMPGVILSAARWRRGRRAFGLVLASAALGVGAALGWATSCSLSAATDTLAHTPVSTLRFRTEGASAPGTYSWRTTAAAYQEGRRLGTVWLATDHALEEGATVTGIGTFAAVSDDEFGRSARARGMLGTVRLARVSTDGANGLAGALTAARRSLLGVLDLEDPGHALAAGMVLGDKTALKSLGVADDFSGAGMAHLTAVSGTHVALVTGLLAGIVGRLKMAREAKGALTLSVAALYVLLCGAPVSALRAWGMSAAAFGSSLVVRRASPLTALGVVGLLIVAWDPCVTGDLGFSLSASCVTALCLVGPWAQGWVERLLPAPTFRRVPTPWRRRVVSLWREVCSSAASSLACSVASAPLCAGAFGSLAVLGPVANVLAAPFIGPFMTLALAALALGRVPVVGESLLGALSVLGRLLCTIASTVASSPLATVAVSLAEPWPLVLTALLLVAVWTWWPRPNGLLRRRFTVLWIAGAAGVMAGVALLAAVLAPPSVTVLDVGQGDAILIRDGLHAVLVDTGPDEAVASAVARAGIRSVDAVVLTHQHDDHVDGLAALPGCCAVGSLVVGSGVAENLTGDVRMARDRLGAELVELSAGDTVAVGSWTLRVVWPQGPRDGSENEDSLCLTLERNGRVWGLLTGDAESDSLAEFIGKLPALAFLKVGHHGSSVAVTPEQAAALAPTVAVASAGEGNPYGHPAGECVTALESAGSVFLCTKDVGDVCVLPDGPAVRVRTAGGAMPYD